jgi:peptidoglycan hydrolase-like protein with peptidoglycan-binding domain
MKIPLTILVFGILLASAGVAPVAHAETSTKDVYTQIESLTAKIAELQKQLAGLTAEVRSVLKEGLSEGMSGDDVKKIQELLATDASIYPEGKITGFFGPLTKEALKRFQKKHALNEDGTLNKDTRAVLEKYLKEHKDLGKYSMKDHTKKDATTERPTKDLEKKEKASAAITAATEEIKKAKDAVADADEDTETERAEEYIEKAKKKLAAATEAFDRAKYEQARGLAQVATRYAKRALTELAE